MQKVTLLEWARIRYKSRVPNINSLYSAAQNNRFHPPAEKEFGMWRVRPDAILINRNVKTRCDDPPELLRILNDGKAP